MNTERTHGPHGNRSKRTLLIPLIAALMTGGLFALWTSGMLDFATMKAHHDQLAALESELAVATSKVPAIETFHSISWKQSTAVVTGPASRAGPVTFSRWLRERGGDTWEAHGDFFFNRR